MGNRQKHVRADDRVTIRVSVGAAQTSRIVLAADSAQTWNRSLGCRATAWRDDVI